ncbi:hypothetical protein [Culicoidibacter larvae]|uniref:Uncharacterized protein n=1 Tax=Culicoidibacter larvae TaxID=2579976 RepID=A0A5R8Q8F4_9FIRM|nr:hypothetical protein [Culicoidibacter larvae]TLG71362.1 hypothetical protein FEZ08_10735 [Culicoidibacter larvae]
MAYVWVNGWTHSRGYDNVVFKFSFNTSSSSVWNNDGQVVSVWGWVSGEWTHYGQLSQYNREWTQTANRGCPGQGAQLAVDAHIQTYDKGGGSWPNWGNRVDVNTATYYNPRFDRGKLALGAATTSSRDVTYSGLDTPQSERLSYQLINGAYAQTANASKSGTLSFTGMEANTKYSRLFGMVPSNSSGPFICGGSLTFDVYPNYSPLTNPTVVNSSVSATSAKTAWFGGFGNKGNASYTNNLGLRNYGNNNNLQSYTDDLTTAGERTFTGLSRNTRYQVRTELVYTYHDGVIYNAGVSTEIYPTYSAVTVPAISVVRDASDPTKAIVSWSSIAGNMGNLKNWLAQICVRRSDSSTIIKAVNVSALTSTGSTILTGLPLDAKLNIRMEISGNYFDGSSKIQYGSTIVLDYVNNTRVYIDGVGWVRGIRTWVANENLEWKPNKGLVKVGNNSGGWS